MIFKGGNFMKKILEKIGKDELLEYWRLSEGRFDAGNFVGINGEFAIFTSISQYGKNGGFRFIKIDDLKKFGKNTEYLEIMKEKIEERKSSDRKIIELEKNKFFKELFKYFKKNKIKLRLFYEDDYQREGYLVKESKEILHFQWCDEGDRESEEFIRKSEMKSIEIGKNVVKDIIVKDDKIQKNKIVIARNDIQGSVIFQDENYTLIYENDLFWADCKFIIIKTSDIWEITEKVYHIETENVSLEEILPDISNMEIKEILKKCFENKILVHFEYEKSYFEKFGIIEKFENDRLILREIDKGSGIFVSKSEILVEDVSFLFVRNCRVLRIMG